MAAKKYEEMDDHELMLEMVKMQKKTNRKLRHWKMKCNYLKFFIFNITISNSFYIICII